jgi:hypothetical protein
MEDPLGQITEIFGDRCFSTMVNLRMSRAENITASFLRGCPRVR